MLGAILGDIAGSRFEFDRGGKTKEFEFITDECTFTDDTVMTIAVADALMNAGIDADENTVKKLLVESMKKWGKKYPDAGYGQRFYWWLKEENPKPYGSYGNGSAMRVSSVGWLYPTLERTIEVARWTAEVSHDHPEGIKGAECTAAVIFLGRTGHSKKEIAEYVSKTFGYDFSESLDKMRKRHKHVETCMDSLPKALRSFFDGEDYEDTVRNAISLGGDTDTLAAIAGAMAEGYQGIVRWYYNYLVLKLGKEMWNVFEKFLRTLNDLPKDPFDVEFETLLNNKEYDKLLDWAYTHDNVNSSKRVLKKVVDAYELLADEGFAMALNNLGSMHYNGRYFKEDRKKAIEYYEKACDLGVKLAYSNLAYCYYYGDENLRVNYRLAFRYFSEGATLFNDANCLYKLGDMYRYGRYLKQDNYKAFQLYVRALNAVNPDDQHDRECVGDIRYRIGDCLLNGIGVSINLLDALFNLNSALNILYERIDTDRYVKGTIKKVKELIKEVEDLLENSNRNREN